MFIRVRPGTNTILGPSACHRASAVTTVIPFVWARKTEISLNGVVHRPWHLGLSVLYDEFTNLRGMCLDVVMVKPFGCW